MLIGGVDSPLGGLSPPGPAQMSSLLTNRLRDQCSQHVVQALVVEGGLDESGDGVLKGSSNPIVWSSCTCSFTRHLCGSKLEPFAGCPNMDILTSELALLIVLNRDVPNKNPTCFSRSKLMVRASLNPYQLAPGRLWLQEPRRQTGF